MRNFIIFILIILSVELTYSQNRIKFDDFQIGIYSLQPPTWSKGHQTGKLSDITSDIISVKEIINATIPYRHWNRVDYPDWDYSRFVVNYISDMYKTTVSNESFFCVQSLTPPLYSSFIDPPVQKLPTNDSSNNRCLNFKLFSKFIEQVLASELELISNFTSLDTSLIKKIYQDKRKRPLGGWYLDDEPLVRNHDIEVIETMGQIIRLIEHEFFLSKKMFSSDSNMNIYDFLLPRYIAFDADDLHDHRHGNNREEGDYYNYNGKLIPFENNELYSVFSKDIIDVLLIDFYRNDPEFWNKIFNDIQNEFNDLREKRPSIMPVINTQIIYEKTFKIKLNSLEKTIMQLQKHEIDGIWLYIWNDNDGSTIDANELWDDDEVNLRKLLKKFF